MITASTPEKVREVFKTLSHREVLDVFLRPDSSTVDFIFLDGDRLTIVPNFADSSVLVHLAAMDGKGGWV